MPEPPLGVTGQAADGSATSTTRAMHICPQRPGTLSPVLTQNDTCRIGWEGT